MGQSEFVGVDGCRSGWFSVGFTRSGKDELEVFRKFSDLLDYYKEAKLILVDMPIGLPDGREERPGDLEAKGKLAGYRDWSVFRAPTRAAAKHFADNPVDRAGTDRVQRGITGEPLSRETFGIMPKIVEVDRVLSTRAVNADPQVREIHPEILFWALNDNRPMGKYKKNSEKGIRERIGVLKRECPQIKEILEASWPKIIEKYFVTDGVDVDVDDVLDALAAAVTAYKGYPDKLQTLPETPPRDVKGFPMEMVYYIS